jgi:hypothetical protein
VAAYRLAKKPTVAKAIDAVQHEARTVAVFGLVQAMEEADSAAAFARLHKNPMALVKATELRAKLSGLLIDRVEVACVDIKGALLEARTRVFGPLDITPKPSEVLTDARGTGTDTDGSGSAGSGQDRNGQPFGD